MMNNQQPEMHKQSDTSYASHSAQTEYATWFDQQISDLAASPLSEEEFNDFLVAAIVSQIDASSPSQDTPPPPEPALQQQVSHPQFDTPAAPEVQVFDLPSEAPTDAHQGYDTQYGAFAIDAESEDVDSAEQNYTAVVSQQHFVQPLLTASDATNIHMFDALSEAPTGLHQAAAAPAFCQFLVDDNLAGTDSALQPPTESIPQSVPVPQASEYPMAVAPSEACFDAEQAAADSCNFLMEVDIADIEMASQAQMTAASQHSQTQPMAARSMPQQYTNSISRNRNDSSPESVMTHQAELQPTKPRTSCRKRRKVQADS